MRTRYDGSVVKDTEQKKGGRMDRALLEYIMKSQGVDRAGLCNKIGMSLCTFSKKMNGKTQFTLDEVKAIMTALNIKDPMPVFFADKVS